MIAALAIAAALHSGGPVTVQAGDTLSGIAASEGVPLSSLEAANPQVSDPNVIFAGETVNSPGSSPAASLAPAYQPSSISGDSASSGGSSSVPISPPSSLGGSSGAPSSSSLPSGGGSGFSIPGMPQSLANCIAFRESTNGTNPAANGNVFGIIPASGFNVAGMSVAQQEQVAGQIYATTGGSAWSANGCPGT